MHSHRCGRGTTPDFNKRFSLHRSGCRRSPWATTKRSIHLGLVGLLLGGLSACAASNAQSLHSGGDHAVPVVAAVATAKTVPLLIQTTGTVQADSTVAVTSQASGMLTGVHFREGQPVHKGDLLFTIDPRPLQAAVDQAVANQQKAIAQVAQAQAQVNQAQAQVNQAQAVVVRDQAQANNAKVEADRYSSLLSEGAISREQADQYSSGATAQQASVQADRSNVGNAIASVSSAKANLQSAQAAVSAANAQVDSARVQLSYASIDAPSDGVAGKLNVNQGNLVTANANTPLVTISQEQPIDVQFAIPQQSLADLKKYQAMGQLHVTATPPQGAPIQGQLVFVDSGLDSTTGTIQLKASFPNTDGRLTPGEFVNLTLQLAQLPNAIVVPATAVQAGQQGSFVYIIQPDHKVQVRQVKVGQAVNAQTVIQSGLQAGDRVVVDGQFNLTPGATVQEKPAGTTTPQTQGNGS